LESLLFCWREYITSLFPFDLTFSSSIYCISTMFIKSLILVVKIRRWAGLTDNWKFRVVGGNILSFFNVYSEECVHTCVFRWWNKWSKLNGFIFLFTVSSWHKIFFLTVWEIISGYWERHIYLSCLVICSNVLPVVVVRTYLSIFPFDEDIFQNW